MNKKYFDDLNMYPNRPHFINDRDKYGVSKNQYKDLLSQFNSVQVRNYSHSFNENRNRQYLYEKAQMEHERNLLEIKQENAILRAQKAESENKAQLAENKLLFQQLMIKKIEYENLISQQQYQQQLSFPPIKTQREGSAQTRRESEPEQKFNFGFIQTKDSQLLPKLDYQQRAQSDEKVQKELGQTKQSFYQTRTSRFRQTQPIIEKRNVVLIFKAHVWMLIAAQRLLKDLQKQKTKNKLIRQLHSYAEEFKEELSGFNQRQLDYSLTKWVETLLKKIFTLLAQPLQVSKKINWEDQIYFDKRRQRFTTILKQFFQLIELGSREDILPDKIKKLMFVQQFLGQTKQPSYFVSIRTQYYNKSLNVLKKGESKMIISEYYFFKIIIEKMFKITNEIEYKHESHTLEAFFFVNNIASLMQSFFIQRFEQLTQLDRVSAKIVQLKLNVESPVLKFNVVEDKQVNKKQIIVGLTDIKQFDEFFHSKPKLKSELQELFEATITNLYLTVALIK